MEFVTWARTHCMDSEKYRTSQREKDDEQNTKMPNQNKNAMNFEFGNLAIVQAVGTRNWTLCGIVRAMEWFGLTWLGLVCMGEPKLSTQFMPSCVILWWLRWKLFVALTRKNNNNNNTLCYFNSAIFLRFFSLSLFVANIIIMIVCWLR